MLYFVQPISAAYHVGNTQEIPVNTPIFWERERCVELALDDIADGSDVVLIHAGSVNLNDIQLLDQQGNMIDIYQALEQPWFKLSSPVTAEISVKSAFDD